MQLFKALFGRKTAGPADSREPATLPLREDTRSELLKIALRDTLHRNGIPVQWIQAECHSATTATRQRGIHLRLVLRQWEPRLLPYAVAVQRSVRQRIMRLDPLAATWLTGISWRLEPQDDTPCPALPAPDFWRQQAAVLQPAAPADDRRHALKAAMDAGDAGYVRPGAAERVDFAPTRPMAELP